MELIAPCGLVAPRRRDERRHRPGRNEAPRNHWPERNGPLPDNFISLRVEEEFTADPALLGTRIVVETFEGSVQLSGIVPWLYQLLWAKQVAWRVGGVRGLHSWIRLARTAEVRPTAGARLRGADAGRPCLEALVQFRGPGSGPESRFHRYR